MKASEDLYYYNYFSKKCQQPYNRYTLAIKDGNRHKLIVNIGCSINTNNIDNTNFFSSHGT